MTPIFLVSLPRSGSTFVQRTLATHAEIATLSEPWLLLPLLYSLRTRGIYTEYGQEAAASAITDFCHQLPGGVADYRAEIAGAARRLYAAAAGGGQARYFLDKTPRYHLIIDDLLAAMPDAKVIVLWRHPLAVAASMIETWGAGRWNLYRYKIDLYVGLANLVAAVQTHGERILTVRYEDLLARPDQAWPPLFDSLGLAYDAGASEAMRSVALSGRLGDPAGGMRYTRTDSEPLHKWRSALSNPLRKAWSRRYLRWIGDRRLRVMGYTLDETLAEVDAVPASLSRLASDPPDMAFGLAFSALEFRLMKRRLQSRRTGIPWLLPHH